MWTAMASTRPTLAIRSEGGTAKVRVARGERDWKRVAHLRAECYYETRSKGRFTTSYKKMFEEQEQRRLETLHNEHRQDAATFVAHLECEEEVVGSVDVSKHGEGTKKELEAYVCNLCVSPMARRRGLGQKLMCAAALHAHDEWKVRSMRAHVDSDNTAARSLYSRIGFRKVGEERRKDSPIGQVFLLEALLPLNNMSDEKVETYENF